MMGGETRLKWTHRLLYSIQFQMQFLGSSTLIPVLSCLYVQYECFMTQTTKFESIKLYVVHV